MTSFILDSAMAWCKKCKVQLLRKKYTLKMHAKTNKHLLHELLPQSSEKDDDFITDEKIQKHKIEVRLALYQALHNKMNASIHLLDVFKATGNTSNSCTLRRTKCTSITVIVLAPIFRKFIISDMILQ